MAPLRAVCAGLLVFVACVVVGHSGRTIPDSSSRIVRDPALPAQSAAPLRLLDEDRRAPTTLPAPHVRPVRASRTLTRPRPAAVPSEGYQAEAIAVICSYDWPCSTAVRIASCESGLRWWAVNPRSSARGIFQILHGPLDLRANVALAYSMWQHRGWQPWVCK